MCLCSYVVQNKNTVKRIVFILPLAFAAFILSAQPRQVLNFNKGWKFFLGDDSTASGPSYDDSRWRTLNLPHDWSIEGSFSKEHPTTVNQGALPAGIGWYRKSFAVPALSKDKR